MRRGVQCRVVSHGSQCGLDLTAREAVRDMLLVKVKSGYLADDLADDAHGLLKLLCCWRGRHRESAASGLTSELSGGPPPPKRNAGDSLLAGRPLERDVRSQR